MMNRGTVTLPNFLIIGAMRCGTTSLPISLGAHLDVYVPQDNVGRVISTGTSIEDRLVCTLVPASFAELASGETTPSCMYSDGDMERIAATLPVADAGKESSDMGRVKVLYIAGWGGSGSTILDNLMGELEGVSSTGELHALWDGVARGHLRCGCGVSVAECEFWSRVLKLVCSDGRVPDSVLRWQWNSVRIRYFPQLLRAWSKSGPTWDSLDRYADAAARLYGAVAEVTGARVIVDSSKTPAYAALLGMLPGVEPYLVHLVRDPRATAYSWLLRRSRPEDRATARGTVDSTWRWVAWNLAVEEVRRRQGPGRSMLVRYEDFVADPRRTVEVIARLVGERAERFPFLDDRTARLGSNHTVSGNRSRFRSGPVTIRANRAWRKEMAPADRLTATVLALPLMRHYRYPIRCAETGDDLGRACDAPSTGARRDLIGNPRHRWCRAQRLQLGPQPRSFRPFGRVLDTCRPGVSRTGTTSARRLLSLARAVADPVSACCESRGDVERPDHGPGRRGMWLRARLVAVGGRGIPPSPKHEGMSANPSHASPFALVVCSACRDALNVPKRVVDRLNTWTHVRYPPMDPTIRPPLCLRFLEGNAALSAWLPT